MEERIDSIFRSISQLVMGKVAVDLPVGYTLIALAIYGGLKLVADAIEKASYRLKK